MLKNLDKKPGQVQFLACQERVEAMLKQGFTVSYIHKELVEGAFLTISRVQLSRYISQYCKKVEICEIVHKSKQTKLTSLNSVKKPQLITPIAPIPQSDDEIEGW